MELAETRASLFLALEGKAISAATKVKLRRVPAVLLHMTAQPAHVTIATTTGVLHWALLTHFGAGLVGLVTGVIALAVAKGARLHRQSGMVFAYAMIETGATRPDGAVVTGCPLGC